MKRLTALILSILLLISIFPVVSASAADNSAKPLLGKDALEKVVALVKSRLEIPAAYTQFNSDVYDNGGKTAFRLRWSTGDYYYTAVNGSIELTVDENGIVNNYYSYSYDRNYDYNRRLPKITTAQAADRARKFLAEMCPDISGQVSADKAIERCTIEYDSSYSFNFYRLVNGIPYYDNNVSIQIDGRNGQVRSMYRNWDDTLVFPKAEKTISFDKAKEAWKKEIGLKLGYRLAWNQGDVRPVLRYSPSSADMMNAIDAVTGGKITVNNIYNPYNDTGYRPDRYYYGQVSGSELDVIKQLKGFMDVQKGEKLARGMKELGIDDNYRMNRYTYNKTGNNSYSLQLEFIRAASKETFGKDIPPEKLKVMIAAGEGGSYATVVFDALTSELLSFNNGGYSAVTPPKKSLSRQDMQKTAEAFLGKYKSARFKQTELTENTPAVNDYMMKYGIPGPQNSGSFVYNRKVNGIVVQDNALNINIDAATGRITSYSEIWDDVSFPSADGIISLDKAYEALFGQNALELKYVTAAGTSMAGSGIPYDASKPVRQELKLVYSPGNNRPVIVDAYNGVLINGATGAEFIDKNNMSFSDLEGNPHKAEIEKLARSGLLPLTKSFRPDDAMLQKDYLYLVLLLRGGSPYGIPAGGELTQTAEDGMYRQVINEGILNEDERAPDAEVTKGEAVKLLLRSIGYGKFAEMKGIFDCSYTDKADIAPDMLGYAAIAGSLGLVDGTAFEPAKKLTRLEAVMMIYSYLDR